MHLDWTAAPQGSDPNAVAGYNIYRGGTTGGPYTQVATLVASTIYDDFQVNPGQTYFYVITTVDTGGAESGFSTESSATVLSP